MLLWLLSFTVFCVIHSAVNSLSFDVQKFGAFRFLLNGAVGLGPWAMSFAVGLLLSGVSILVVQPGANRREVVWKRALIFAWIPAAIFLYAGWKSEGYRERDEQKLVKNIVELRNRLSQKVLADQSKFVAEIKKIDVPSMLAADTLISRAGISRNREKLAQLAILYDRQAVLSRENRSELQRQLNEIIFSHSMGADVSRSVDATLKERADLETQFFDNERRFIGAMSTLNDFMSAQLERAISQGGRILFKTDDEAKQYNAYVQEVMKLVRHEADLLAQIQRVVDEGAKTFDQLTH